MPQVILSIDVGSSSIRCTAYRLEPRTRGCYRPPQIHSINGCCAVRKGSTVRAKGGIALTRICVNSDGNGDGDGDENDCTTSENAHLHISAAANEDGEGAASGSGSVSGSDIGRMNGVSEMEVEETKEAKEEDEGLTIECNENEIEPKSKGDPNSEPDPHLSELEPRQKNIQVSLFEDIDACIDETLQKLRVHFQSSSASTSTSTSSSSSSSSSTQSTKPKLHVVGIGITTFAMNLIGIRADGSICHESCTLTYACNDKRAQKQCEVIKNILKHEGSSSVGVGASVGASDGASDGASVGIVEVETETETETEAAMYQRTGAPIHNAFALAQLRVMYDENSAAQNTTNDKDNDNVANNDDDDDDDDQDEKSGSIHDVARWLSISSICIARWTNSNLMTMPISYSEASWTGMWQFRSGKWDEECLALLPPKCRDALPTVKSYQDPNCIFRIVKNEVTKDWPELWSLDGSVVNGCCQVFLGFGDGACANIGSKCTSADRIAVTIGTSAAARVCIPLPIDVSYDPTESIMDGSDGNQKKKKRKISSRGSVPLYTASNFKVPPGLFCYRIDDATILLGGALTDGGSVIAWLRDLLNLKTEEDYTKCQDKVDQSYALSSASYGNASKGIGVDSSSSSDDQLTFIPFLSGERSTGYRGGATGSIMGLTRNTKSEDLLRESLESVVLRINAILSLIRSSLVGPTKTFADTTTTKTTSSSSSGPITVKDGVSKVSDGGGGSCIIASGNALEKNKLWRQMLADCSGLPVVLDGSTQEGTSRGAALMVAKAISYKGNRDGPMNETLQIDDKLTLDTNLKRYWDERKEKQERFIETMEPLWTG